MSLAVTDALLARIAEPEPVFTYMVERAGLGRRVAWKGGIRNDVPIPSGDVILAPSEVADGTYDRLLAALRGGGFIHGTGI